MTVTEIRNILESPYDRKVWKSFLQTQFTNNQLNAEDRPIVLSDKTISKKCVSLGNYEVNEFTRIGIFEIELNEKVNLSRNRVALRNLLKDISAQVAGAMVVFVQGERWRFSYISKRKVKNAETNLIETKETAPKRYTYLFGKGEKALTAAQRFDKLIQKQKGNLYQFLNLEDFEEAFSVEKLGKDFFKDYKEIYEDFVEYITGTRYVKRAGKWSFTKVHNPHFDFHDVFKVDDKAVRDFFKRMLGRIVFLYFIQKKGWMAVEKDKNWDEGNPDYLFQLYNNAKYKELFYSDYLVPLFFETLNDPNSENEDNEFRFPYLNGGLFDKSQDFLYDKLALPSQIFDKLFLAFNSYNFTVYEDAPDEHTIAVDPEMLGHIFENLLEDNKDKGAFYTPKEIVHYMSKESLFSYLVSKQKYGNEKQEFVNSTIKKILHQHELDESEEKFAEKHAFAIIDDLKQVRICDPAIGSGAFPMGLLQEIFNTQIFLMELSGFTKNISDAHIKKHIIEESIYGVDIDPGAVDIARLRFWLSLVVDEPQPQPLPNLSFKIVCANTLIPLGQPKGDLGLTNEIADEIEKIRERYFDANKENKKDLEREFRNQQNKLWTNAREWTTGSDAEIYRKISEFNPFEDKSCSWFDPWWMFGIRDGFDIVIGNPPYLSISKTKDKKKIQNIGYTTFANTGDLYSLFYEVGNNLLKEGGFLNFITSRQWINASYGKSTRKFFANNTNPIVLIDFGKAKLFDAATVFVNILVFQKAKNQNHLKACLMPDDYDPLVVDVESYFDENAIVLSNLSESVWKIGEEKIGTINELIEKRGTKLQHFPNIQFFRGITSGFNKAFHIPEDIKNDLINKDPKNAEIIKPLLRGKDIKRYKYDFENIYLINTHNGIKDKGIPPINVKKDYKTIYQYLSQWQEDLEARDDKGVHWSNLRNCAFLEEFEKEKIVWIEISDKANYAYDTEGMFLTNSAYFISGNGLKYILAVLNSKVADFYFFQITAKIAGGRKRYTKQYVEQIPIPIIESNKQYYFEKMIDYLLYLNNKESVNIFSHTPNERIANHFEDILNMMVYELYFEDHMKKESVNLDVLQYIIPQLESLEDLDLHDDVKKLYEWYQQPENYIRQRINMIDIKSPDILSIINLSI